MTELYGQVMVMSPRTTREAWSGRSGLSWAIGVADFDASKVALSPSTDAMLNGMDGYVIKSVPSKLLIESSFASSQLNEVVRWKRSRRKPEISFEVARCLKLHSSFKLIFSAPEAVWCC